MDMAHLVQSSAVVMHYSELLLFTSYFRIPVVEPQPITKVTDVSRSSFVAITELCHHEKSRYMYRGGLGACNPQMNAWNRADFIDDVIDSSAHRGLRAFVVS